MYLVFVITILNMVNIQTLHSNNLELAIEVSLVTVVLWVLIGAYIIYYAQAQMKRWYRLENIAN